MLISIPFSPKFMQVYTNNEASVFYPCSAAFNAKAILYHSRIETMLNDSQQRKIDIKRVNYSVCDSSGTFHEVAKPDTLLMQAQDMQAKSGNSIKENECKALILLSNNKDAQFGFFNYPKFLIAHWFTNVEMSIELPLIKIKTAKDKKTQKSYFDVNTIATVLENSNSITKDYCHVAYRFRVDNNKDHFSASIDDQHSFLIDANVFRRDILRVAFEKLNNPDKNISTEDLFFICPCLVDEGLTLALAEKLKVCDEETKKIALEMILANYENRMDDCKRILFEIEHPDRDRHLARNVLIGATVALVIGVIVFSLALSGVGVFAAGGILAAVGVWLSASLPAACVGAGIATTGMALLGVGSVLTASKGSDVIEKNVFLNGSTQKIAKKLGVSVADMSSVNELGVASAHEEYDGVESGSCEPRVESAVNIKLK